MLILGRRPGESIVIAGGITIVVLASDRGGVRLGIQAPGDVAILRGEIVDQVAEENRRATAAADAHRAWVATLAAGAAPAGGPAGSTAGSTAGSSAGSTAGSTEAGDRGGRPDASPLSPPRPG